MNPTTMSGLLDEIVVTADKRGEQSAQDLVGSITAFDEAKLERLNAIDFEEMIVHVPSTNYIDNGGPARGFEVASIRGLSRVSDTSDAIVAQYLDGAPRFASRTTECTTSVRCPCCVVRRARSGARSLSAA